MKEVREYEEQKARDNLDLAERGDDGSEGAGKFLEDAEKKYADMQETKEIQAELKMIEDAYNGRLSKGTKEINAFFDQMQYQVDIFNIEAKARKHQNPYESQRDICNKVDEKERQFRMAKAKNEYFKAMAEGRYADAKEHFKKWKKEGFDNEVAKIKKINQVIETNTGYFNPDSEAVLSINQDNGELNDKEAWKLAMGKEVTKDDVAKKESIPQTDKDGNTKYIEKWLAKPETIEKLFKDGKINEALNLQNQRNMVIALQGDSQAIQKAQAESLVMLSKQINNLKHTVAAIGNIAAHFLQMEAKERKEVLSHSGNIEEGKETPYHTQKAENDFTKHYVENLESLGFGKFDDIFEENQESGRIKFKTTNKDTSGILGD